MNQEPRSWWDIDFDFLPTPRTTSTQVDYVHLAQPIGFVWHSKPRYRVKARTRKVEASQ